MRPYFPLLTVLLFATLPVHAGVVQTLTARLEGKVVLDKDHIAIGEKKIPWAEVLYLLPDSATRTVVHSQRVVLKSGETWAVELLALADGKLEVRSDLFGVKKIDVGLISSIDFRIPPGAATERKTGTLYRVKGEPVRGKLLAITKDKAVVDSAVGELEFARPTLAGYRFADVAASTSKGEDEVVLVDGSVLRGKLALAADGLKLEHAVLGPVALPAAALRSVVRHPAQMLDLIELTPQSVQTTLVLATEKSNSTLRTILSPERESARFIKGLVCEPKTEIVYKLPKMDGKKGRLRALLGPIAGAQGDVRVKIQAGKKVLVDRELVASAKVEMIELDVMGGDELAISVDFGARLRFPCGIVLGDPHVLWEP